MSRMKPCWWASEQKMAGEVYIEFIQQGRYVKVTAVDADTGTEASIVGDASTPQKQLEQLAAQKLRYVLNKGKK